MRSGAGTDARVRQCDDSKARRNSWRMVGHNRSGPRAGRSHGYSTEFDMATYFLHDVPQDVLRSGPEKPREEAETVFSEPCRFDHWPDAPIHVLAGRGDR